MDYPRPHDQYYYMLPWDGWCTMKILVLSDSHSGLRFMRSCIEHIKPEAVVHLGDHYDDAQAMSEAYPDIPFHMVPGNCDRYRCPPFAQEILVYPVCGIKLYMTHGHLHNVKQGIYRLLADARASGAQAVLFGHTHQALCRQEADGLWILNPGSCGYGGGSAGLINVEQGSITACTIVEQAELA